MKITKSLILLLSYFSLDCWTSGIALYSEHQKKTSWIPVVFNFFLFINLACLYPINVKTAKPIGPEFCVGPHVTPGKVYEWSKFQKLMFKSFIFIKFWKCAKKIFWNPQTFFINCKKRRCSQIKPQLKLKKKMSVKRLKSLVYLKMSLRIV